MLLELSVPQAFDVRRGTMVQVAGQKDSQW